MKLLDGIGAGIFGAIPPLVIADLMWGTGRYNVAQGFVGTAQGIGASTIGLVAGLIVDRFGYSAAFLTAAAVACASAATMYFTMPGTSPCRVLRHAGDGAQPRWFG